MAEEGNRVLRFIRGLFKDTSHVDQPPGSLRFARNASINNTTAAVSNEPGNVKVESLPVGAIVIGTIPLTSNDIVLFLKVGDDSIIGVYKNDAYQTILNLQPALNGNATDLNFQASNPIQGTFKEQGDGDLIVYWTDDLNPPRVLNITRQLPVSSNSIYGKFAVDSPDSFFVNILNLFPHAGPVPHVELVNVFTGGGCLTGVYYITLAYTDEDINTTNYLTVANPVSIVDDPEGVSPIESYDGAEGGILTGKSIVWEVSNINTDMKYLSVQILQKINGVITAVRLHNIEIYDRDTFKITYSGEESQATSSIDAVTIDMPEYLTAKTMEQLDSVLYLGNLTSDIDIGYQKYANFIKSEAVVLKDPEHKFDPFDPMVITDDFFELKKSTNNAIEKGYRYPKNIYNYKGYTREEVYAFYIAFILKSGKMSYAYHIPGREPISNLDPNLVNELMGDTNPTSVNEGGSLYQNGYGIVGDWQIINLTSTDNPQGYLFHFYDFSHLTFQGSRNMNYWHNLHEFYPNNENFEVVNAQDPTLSIPSLQGENVRHHRFPSNRNEEFTTVKSVDDQVFDKLDEQKASVHWFWFGQLDDSENVIRGRYTNDDPSGAQEWQNDNYGTPMGGTGTGHDTDAHDDDTWYRAFYFNNAPPNGPYPGTGSLPSSPAGLGGTPNDITAEAPNGQTDTTKSCYPPSHEYFYNWPTDVNPNQPLNTIWDTDISDYSDLTFVYDSNPPEGMNLVIAYDRAPGIDLQPSLIGHCAGGVSFANVSGYSGDDILLRDLDEIIGNNRPGWAAWVEPDSPVSNENENIPLTHHVQPLGIKFSDIKIPKSIADKVQGFRIYYADRTHEQRTVLGQAPVHPMQFREDMDPSRCDTGGLGIGKFDYWLQSGQPAPKNPEYPELSSVYSFHDFYLLNRHPSLAAATHIKLQYVLCMANFKGPVKFNVDGKYTDTESSTDEPFYSCRKPDVITSFHIAGAQFRIQGVNTRLNYILSSKSKAYILGDSIYEGTHQGFDHDIYNQGGQTHIALRPSRFLPHLVSNPDSKWRDQRSEGARTEFVSYTTNNIELDDDGDPFPGNIEAIDGLQLYLANLKAFKSDVYNAVDSQNLVWTGYEVVGDDLDKFILDENNSPIYSGPNQFCTDDIYGGDTYISRYGYRMTSREEVSSTPDGNQAKDIKSVIACITESTENINYRHIDNDDEPYFPGASLKSVLNADARIDLHYNPDLTTGKIRYNEDYSSINNIKVVLPFPFVLEQPENHPVRIIRSAKTTSSILSDNYRKYSFGELRELNNRYGELWKITAVGNLLLFHMEDALYQTKGKQKMKVSEGNEAFIGQGDIFTQEPDLVQHTDSGYLGTRSQFANIVTPQGYFFVDNIDRKMFLLGKGAEELSGEKYGMSNWLQDNMPYALEDYGFHGKTDSFITGMGFHAVYDERFSRIIITKRDLAPTAAFIGEWSGAYTSLNAAAQAGAYGIVYINGTYYRWTTIGQNLSSWEPIDLDNTQITGSRDDLFERKSWTISFVFSNLVQNKLGSWESFHDYVPYMYSYSGIDVFSFTESTDSDIQRSIWRHNDYNNMGNFYGTIYPFEIEVISNMVPNIDKVFNSFSFFVDTKEYSSSNKLYNNDLNSGFTSYITYNSDMLSGEHPLEYLINTRRIGTDWKVNQFRDMSKEITDTSNYYTGITTPFTGTNYITQGQNLFGGSNAGTITAITDRMFSASTTEAYNEPMNINYIDPNKEWYKQSKFIDKYMGIRLSCNNEANNLVNLYTVLADFRTYKR